MANKWGKRLLTITALTAAAAGIAYILNEKKQDSSDDEFSDDFEDEDFDLDDDFENPSEREYVSLTPNASEEEDDTNPDEETDSK